MGGFPSSWKLSPQLSAEETGTEEAGTESRAALWPAAKARQKMRAHRTAPFFFKIFLIKTTKTIVSKIYVEQRTVNAKSPCKTDKVMVLSFR